MLQLVYLLLRIVLEILVFIFKGTLLVLMAWYFLITSCCVYREVDPFENKKRLREVEQLCKRSFLNNIVYICLEDILVSFSDKPPKVGRYIRYRVHLQSSEA